MVGSDEILQVTPVAAWEILSNDQTAQLVDVRTRAEWGFVGVPDTSELGKRPFFVEWAAWPDMKQSSDFSQYLMAELGPSSSGPLLFLCRSGVRSHHAALAVTKYLHALGQDRQCMNVAEGFEGELDAFGHRGCLNGWKFHGLPWSQS